MAFLQGPLFGGGFAVALTQLSTFYYLVAFLLHSVVPALLPSLPSVQKEPRATGDVRRDALASIGPLAVKAGIWVLVEKLHAAGYGLMYDEMPR